MVQGDANRDLADYPDDAFDYAILSQTLRAAGDAARQGMGAGAAAQVRESQSLLRGMRAIVPGFEADLDIERDLAAIANALAALSNDGLIARPNALADLLLYASYRELMTPVTQ